eukprot:gnl/Hemi2/26241_TR8809_c1_g1_i1.p1 gnl/Hemi2/26241_TR8809_c1_g1~~gnl/Hemi2/26241_TR8809_c1_g1_i1.p1  ORF type:complete len:264 (-),score=31.49 gnl/Hemi2/26241_TR8809_c1_g1_i1:45-836(-)
MDATAQKALEEEFGEDLSMTTEVTPGAEFYEDLSSEISEKPSLSEAQHFRRRARSSVSPAASSPAPPNSPVSPAHQRPPRRGSHAAGPMRRQRGPHVEPDSPLEPRGGRQPRGPRGPRQQSSGFSLYASLEHTRNPRLASEMQLRLQGINQMLQTEGLPPVYDGDHETFLFLTGRSQETFEELIDRYRLDAYLDRYTNHRELCERILPEVQAHLLNNSRGWSLSYASRLNMYKSIVLPGLKFLAIKDRGFPETWPWLASSNPQ